jgi:hypothetical protein
MRRCDCFRRRGDRRDFSMLEMRRPKKIAAIAAAEKAGFSL